MMIKISYKDLQIISSCLTSIKDDSFTQSFNQFLKEEKDDYYVYGRDTGIETFEITIQQLKRIISYVSIHQHDDSVNLNTIYQTALVSSQKSIFIGGKNRHE